MNAPAVAAEYRNEAREKQREPCNILNQRAQDAIKLGAFRGQPQINTHRPGLVQVESAQRRMPRIIFGVNLR